MKSNSASLSLPCPRCTYEGNASTATHCELCGHPLKQSSVVRGNLLTRYRFVPFRNSVASVFLLIALGLVGSGLWWFTNQLKPVRPSKNVNSLNSPKFEFDNLMQDVKNVPSGLFSFGGAHTFAALNSDIVIGAITKAHPGFHLRYTQPLNNNPGSSTGIAMLLKGELTIAQTARPLYDAEYSNAKNRGFTLEQVPVAIDGIAFYTHPNLPIAGLSIDQLQEIFRGHVSNWKQVGGPDLPLVPVAVSPKITSSIKLLLNSQGEDVGSNVQIVGDYTEAIRKVASSPGGISYGSVPIVLGQRTIHFIGVASAHSEKYIQPFTNDGKVNKVAFQNDTYPLTRRVFVIIRRDGTLDEKAGVAYINLLLSNEGQQLVEKVGFVAIR